jgi:predicted metal-dependent hydrolase
MTFDWSSGELAEGLACYRAGRFFEAHEHWEIVWLTLAEPEKSFLQSLIQISAAFHHLEAGNKKGAASLLRRAFKRIEHRNPVFGGIDIATLRDEVGACLQVMEAELSKGILVAPKILPVTARPD